MVASYQFEFSFYFDRLLVKENSKLFAGPIENILQFNMCGCIIPIFQVGWMTLVCRSTKTRLAMVQLMVVC